MEAPLLLSSLEVSDEAEVATRIHGGQAQAWHRYVNPGGLQEAWPEIYEAVQHAGDFIADTGPYDGLCGFGQGGEVAAMLAKVAEEGNSELRDAFKFVLCFSTVWPKGAQWRPQAPLTVPLCHVYETVSGRYSPADYEHLSVHWLPEARTLIPHQEGYRIPELSGQGFMQLRQFLQGFQRALTPDDAGDRFEAAALAPAVSSEGDLCDSVLALPRSPASPLPAGRLMVVCFHDAPPTCEATPQVFDGLAALVAKVPAFQRRLALDAPDLRRYVVMDGLAAEAAAKSNSIASSPGLKMLAPHHEVSTLARRIAETALEEFAEGDYERIPVAIVGHGFGAYVGLLYAQVLQEIGKVVRFVIDEDVVTARIAAMKFRQGDHERHSYRLERIETRGRLPGMTRWAELDEERMTLSDDLGHSGIPYQLISGGGRPWKLYAVHPPAVFPGLRPGALGELPICSFCDGSDTGGERWRWEVATTGPYEARLLAGREGWAEEVVQELQQEVERANAPNRR